MLAPTTADSEIEVGNPTQDEVCGRAGPICLNERDNSGASEQVVLEDAGDISSCWHLRDGTDGSAQEVSKAASIAPTGAMPLNSVTRPMQVTQRNSDGASACTKLTGKGATSKQEAPLHKAGSPACRNSRTSMKEPAEEVMARLAPRQENPLRTSEEFTPGIPNSDMGASSRRACSDGDVPRQAAPTVEDGDPERTHEANSAESARVHLRAEGRMPGLAISQLDVPKPKHRTP